MGSPPRSFEPFPLERLPLSANETPVPELPDDYPHDIEPYTCLDCSTDCYPVSSDDYVVLDEVWARTGLAPDAGTLCLPCLTKRLERSLTIGDFESLDNAPVNAPIYSYYRRTGQIPASPPFFDQEAFERAFIRKLGLA